jgi:hypothetical protein
LVIKHWEAKKLVAIQKRTNLLVMTKKLVGYAMIANQTSHISRGRSTGCHLSTLPEPSEQPAGLGVVLSLSIVYRKFLLGKLK